ncbi:hypothetical protein AGMMS50267_14290 [Spirochaetia bacterium]|nr:hypothetical protein AGMMS50267_14290 [Spirochaetia bacterium]
MRKKNATGLGSTVESRNKKQPNASIQQLELDRNHVERIILRDILKTGNLYNFNEFFFRETAHKYISCACRYVQRDKTPISLKTVCQCLREYSMADYADVAADIVGAVHELH